MLRPFHGVDVACGLLPCIHLPRRSGSPAISFTVGTASYFFLGDFLPGDLLPLHLLPGLGLAASSRGIRDVIGSIRCRSP
ncbi:hypothetical protein KSP40_PGU008107 [Platanthera guangdongensis]|uniref:Uncharacterized protein n=1 Tax=Platanthera guangdongensis TaxID=2320717 RepID=A0ABR2LPM1_9ASPA